LNEEHRDGFRRRIAHPQAQAQPSKQKIVNNYSDDGEDSDDLGASDSSLELARQRSAYTSGEFFSMDEDAANAIIEGYDPSASCNSDRFGSSSFNNDNSNETPKNQQQRSRTNDQSTYGLFFSYLLSTTQLSSSHSALFLTTIGATATWNERFQTLLQKTFHPNSVGITATPDPEADLNRTIQLQKLCDDFAKEAKRIGVVIIREMFLDLKQKSIQPVTYALGGVAGGEKYIYKGIFFKFAVDFLNLYGGHEFALKTAEVTFSSPLSSLFSSAPILHRALL